MAGAPAARTRALRRVLARLASCAMTCVVIGPAVQAALQTALHAHGAREFVALLGGPTAPRYHVTCLQPLANVATHDDAFVVPPAAFAAGLAALERRGACWLGFVHSHPGATAALSRRDHATLWRDCLQLVVGGGAAAPTWAAFVGDAAGFVPLPVQLARAAAEPA